MAEGREGDWECCGCKNRNYAFRSFCNRCKQPRLLVDTKTPPDSKWLPRIGDWICTGCTNNNYASREKCKKCGQPKDVAAMPAIAMPGVFSRNQGVQQSMHVGLIGNAAFQPSLPLSSSWSLGGTDRYGAEAAPSWPLAGSNGSVVPYANNVNQLSPVPKGWRNGDWMCNCGFHNYSSRAQCKKCNAAPPAVGIKRLASDDSVHHWDNKRLNSGPATSQYLSYPGIGPISGSVGNQRACIYAPYSGGGSAGAPNMQVHMQVPQLPTIPALIGKGAKQWRDGDWMCTNCSNHNYASRSQCNRCKTQRMAIAQPVGV
ncbi:hypothetical protein Ancab_003184 [Ancistrocladus abbreviatus]